MRFKSQLLSTIMLLVFFTAPASVLAEPFFFPPMECPTLFSPTPIAFRESVERLKDDYVVFSNFEIPGGLGGDYVIFAFFTKEKVKDLDNVFMAIVSNIASANFTISNNW